MTLEADEDNDHANGSAVFVHSAEDGGYDEVTAELTATESDNDTAAITLSKTTLSVTEGGTASYNVKLSTQPVGQRHRHGGAEVRRPGHQPVGEDRRVTDVHQFQLEHQPERHPASFGGQRPRQRQRRCSPTARPAAATITSSAELTATESDNDTAAITLSKTTLSVTEGGTASYSVKLATQPSANVTVSVERQVGQQSGYEPVGEDRGRR